MQGDNSPPYRDYTPSDRPQGRYRSCTVGE